MYPFDRSVQASGGHPRVGIKATLFLRVALPLLLILAGLVYAGLAAVESIAERRLQRDIELVTRAIRVTVSSALEQGDTAALGSSLESVFRMGQVYGAYVFNADGELLVARGAVEPGSGEAVRLSRITATEEGRDQGVYERISGRHVYSFFVPLFDRAGQPSGLLQVTRRHSDFEREFQQLRQWAWLLFGALTLLVVGALHVAHERAIGVHVRQLLASMRRVREGDRRHRAEATGPGELRTLAEELNRMLDAIRKAQARALRQRRERQSLRRQLRESRRMAELGQLSSGVAHELGAPLSVVDGRAQRLARRIEDADASRELDQIREQVARMAAIVRQLLDFGRSSRAARQTRPVVDWVQRAMALEAGSGRVRLDGPPDLLLQGDGLRLEHALANLVRNAFQACPAGPVAISWCDAGDGFVQIAVEDGGPGIPLELRHQVFEPFFTSRGEEGGTGLGMAIARSVVREHGGEISIGDSRLGGARIELRLPLAGDSE